jgi:hypothetical protein
MGEFALHARRELNFSSQKDAKASTKKACLSS